MGLASIFIQTAARTAEAAGDGLVQHRAERAPPARGKRKRGLSGCAPCQRMQAIETSKEFARELRGGGGPPPPPKRRRARRK